MGSNPTSSAIFQPDLGLDIVHLRALFTFSVKEFGQASGFRCNAWRRGHIRSDMAEEPNVADKASQLAKTLTRKVNKTHLRKAMINPHPNTDLRFFPQAVALVLECKNRWLFLQNIVHDLDSGLWGTPGGKVEPGESPLQAIGRELQEETGLSLREEAFFFLRTVQIAPDHRTAYALHIFHTQLAEYPDKIALDPREHQHYAWLKLEEALQYPLIPFGKQLIRLLANEQNLQS